MKTEFITRRRVDAVKSLSKANSYRKHHHGIKFTRVYFKDGTRCKIDNSGCARFGD